MWYLRVSLRFCYTEVFPSYCSKTAVSQQNQHEIIYELRWQARLNNNKNYWRILKEKNLFACFITNIQWE